MRVGLAWHRTPSATVPYRAATTGSWEASIPSTDSAASSGVERLITARPIGAEFVVLRDRPHAADLPVTQVDLSPRVGQCSVEVQQYQPARRSAHVVQAGHRLLSPVAPLGQVHRRPDEPEFVRQRLVVGVGADGGNPGGDPQRVQCPRPALWSGRTLPAGEDHFGAYQVIGADRYVLLGRTSAVLAGFGDPGTRVLRGNQPRRQLRVLLPPRNPRRRRVRR